MSIDNKKISLARSFRKKYADLEKGYPFQINKSIATDLSRFVKNDQTILSALIQNPLARTVQLKDIKNTFGHEIYINLKKLNGLNDLKMPSPTEFDSIKDIILLYLINCKYALKHNDKLRQVNHEIISRKKLRFAMKLLEKIELTEIKNDLEDLFFSHLEPKIYSNYQSLLKFTQKEYHQRQLEATRNLKSLLQKNKIKAHVEARVKTICSIHNKITKKHLLFSQILDTIGIRIIVGSEDDCYRSMVFILKNSPLITSKIKDYIAVPKENGYQSIHLTVLYENYPMEIQIRTWEMHERARFGGASHKNYKNANE